MKNLLRNNKKLEKMRNIFKFIQHHIIMEHRIIIIININNKNQIIFNSNNHYNVRIHYKKNNSNMVNYSIRILYKKDNSNMVQ